MFYGATIKPGAVVKLNVEDGEVLHISGACLSNATNDERTYLILNQNEKNHVLCVLRKDHTENVPLDLFVASQEGGYFKVQGKSEVHVVGYYEPMADGADTSDDEEALLGSEDESTNVSDEEKKQAVKGSKGAKQKKIQEQVNEDDDEDEDDDDDELDDDDEDDKQDDDDDEDEDDEDEDEKDIRQVVQQQLTQKQQMGDKKKKQKFNAATPVSTTSQDTGKKRKAADPVSTKPEKQQKSGGVSQTVIVQFEKSISDYLKKHGRSLISQVASTCPKPTAITSKYREFLISRPSFVVEGQHISLKA